MKPSSAVHSDSHNIFNKLQIPVTVKASRMIISYNVNHLLRNRMLLEIDVLSSLKVKRQY